MSKLTREQKEEIYEKPKKGYMLSKLSKEYRILENRINYFVRLIDYHGIGILGDANIKWNYTIFFLRKRELFR